MTKRPTLDVKIQGNEHESEQHDDDDDRRDD